MLNSINQASQMGNYSSSAINQQVASALTDSNTENNLSLQFITVGNSTLDLKKVEEKEDNLFNGIKRN